MSSELSTGPSERGRLGLRWLVGLALFLTIGALLRHSTDVRKATNWKEVGRALFAWAALAGQATLFSLAAWWKLRK